jgi:hypothetical protein
LAGNTQHTKQPDKKDHSDEISRLAFTLSTHSTRNNQAKTLIQRKKNIKAHIPLSTNQPTNQRAPTPTLQLAYLPSLCPNLHTYNAKPTNLYTHSHAHQSNEPSKLCPQQASPRLQKIPRRVKKKRKFLCSTDRARQKAMQPSPSKEEQYTQRGEPTTGDFARAVKQ